MNRAEALEQFAKDLQSLLSGAVNAAPVYYGEAPRDESGALSVSPPFVRYTADTRAPADESGEYLVDVFVDVWALNAWANAYREAILIDDALTDTAYSMQSGTMFCHQNGLVMQRGDRDPEDPRILRMSGQYLIRFYPKIDE